MSARITFSLTSDNQLEIWLNESGRDLLVRELQQLSERHDHFHFGPKNEREVGVSSIAYKPDDRVLDYGKVLFRTDGWDRQYFPHVIPEKK